MRIPSHHLPGRKTVTADYTLKPGESIAVDTRGGSFNVTLPAEARNDNSVHIAEAFGVSSLAARPVTVLSGVAGRMVDGNVDTWLLNVDQAQIELAFHQTSNNWLTYHNVGSTTAPPTSSNLNLAGLGGQGVVVNGAETGFEQLTGVNGGTF